MSIAPDIPTSIPAWALSNSERHSKCARRICPPELLPMVMIFSWVNPLERGPARKSKSWVGKAVEGNKALWWFTPVTIACLVRKKESK